MEGQNGGNEPTNPQNSGGASTPAPENGDIFNGGAGLGGGGIYSNPDLTIDKDAIPEEVSNAPVNPPAGDAGRVAAAFANTDASQKAAMTPSIVGSTATQSTATGDIKLARGPRPKRSKAPFIIIGIGVVAIAVIVILLTILGPSSMNKSLLQAFDNYRLYLEDGPEVSEDVADNSVDDSDPGEFDEEETSNEVADEPSNSSRPEEDSSDDEWFIFADNRAISGGEYLDYLSELKKRYDGFIDQVNGSGLKDEDIMQDISSYTDALDFILDFSRLEYYQSELLTVYQEKGRDEAVATIEERLQTNDLPEYIDSAYYAYKDYIESEADLLEVYRERNCLFEDGVDYGCVSNLYDNEDLVYTESSDVRSEKYENLYVAFESIKDYFQVKTNEIYEFLGGAINE